MKLNELIKQKFSGKHILIILIFSLFAFTSNAQSGNQITQLLSDAETAYASGDYGTALYSYQKVLRLKGSDAVVQQKIEFITKMLDEKPDILAQQIENAIIRGEDLLKKNDYPAAKKEFEKALALDPSSQYPLDKLSQIRQKYTDPDDAGNYEAAVQKAAGLMKQYKYDEAIRWYNIARSANPDAKLPIEKIAEARRLKADYEVNRTKYNTLITQADKQLAESKREDAQKTYTDALALFPDEKYPKDKLAEINSWFADKKAIQDAYDAAVNAGDAFYINRDFANARIKYQEALKAKPDARYPKDMLEKSKTGEAQLATVREQYDNLISSADKFYAASDWNAALQGYTSASELLPAEEYPKSQISKIQKTQADQLSKKQQYDNLIAEADAFFVKNDFTNAITKYKTAQPLQPQETYPATKISEINKLIADKLALETGYSNAVKLADASFAKKDYTSAKKLYNDALGFKPEENYSREKIAEIEKIEESNRSLAENYAATILKADQFFAAENWQEALNSYKEASDLKSEEKYPKTRITEVTAKIDALDKQNKSYNDLIAAADAAFGNGEFSVAKTKYTGALAIKPTESYPKEKLSEIDIKLADAAKLDADFKAAMENGAQLFGKNDLTGALSAYKTASLIKPAEKLPAQKIEEINKLMAANQAKDENYSSLIQQADKAFTDGELNASLDKYKSASAMKPAEEYPKQRIDAINKILTEKKALDDEYLTLITSADQLFESLKYENAIAEYDKALKLKPAEKYPVEQIAAINDIIAKNKSIDEQYKLAVADGDKLFATKNYEDARIKFENALSLKNKENYPQQKITEIDLLLNEIKTRNKNYEQAVKSGDDFFNQTKYREALEPYQRANTVKPEEKYPLDQIARINDTLNLQTKREEDFKALLAQADKNFTDKKYEEAKDLYSRSLNIKPSEKYPAEKISEINGILGKQKETQDTYHRLIVEGDAAFAAKDFEKALNSYNEALKVIPADKMAQDKIVSAQAEIKKRDDNYKAQLVTADKSFADKQYTQAIDQYNQALQIKPNEKYPLDKIAEINSMLQKQKETRDAFDKLIAEGDVALAAKDFEKALNSYNEALKVIPAEKTAQDKIASAQTEIKKRDDNYKAQLAIADKSFADKQYPQAIDQYNQALLIKPNEKYPSDKIAEISSMLQKQKETRDAFDKLIAEGDVAFTAADFEKALNSYSEALKVIPAEKTAQDKIASAQAEIKKRDENYNSQITSADKAFTEKNYSLAIDLYNKASQIKPKEDYPGKQILKITNLLEQEKEQQEKMYGDYIKNADALLASQDLLNARTEYNKALSIKSNEQYPKDKIIEINTMLTERSKAAKAEYDKIIVEADKYYQAKVLDQALETYTKAALVKPDESYPVQMVNTIRKYITDHAFVNLNKQNFALTSGDEKKFSFTAIEPRLKKNNYILIHAKASSSENVKVYLNYGKDGQKNGGVVLRNLSTNENDILVRISVQDKWYREDNNWISLNIEGGTFDVSRMDIIQGDE